MRYVRLDEAENVTAEIELGTPLPRIKNLPSGRPSARPLVDDAPDLAWWQQLNGFRYDVKAAVVTKVYDVGPKPLRDVKAMRKAQLKQLYADRLALGFEYPQGSGRHVQIRDEDRDNIGNVGSEARWSKAAGGAGWQPDFAWRMLENDFLPLPTPDDMISLGVAAKVAFLIIRRRYWTLADQIDQLQSAAAVAAFDLTPNW